MIWIVTECLCCLLQSAWRYNCHSVLVFYLWFKVLIWCIVLIPDYPTHISLYMCLVCQIYHIWTSRLRSKDEVVSSPVHVACFFISLTILGFNHLIRDKCLGTYMMKLQHVYLDITHNADVLSWSELPLKSILTLSSSSCQTETYSLLFVGF